MFPYPLLVPSHLEAFVLEDLKIDLNIIGIGPIESALSAYEILFKKKPKTTFLTGWAGAYPETELNIGDITIATYEVLADFGRKYKTHYTNFPQNLKACNILELNNPFIEKTIQLLENCGFYVNVGPLATVCSATYDSKRAYFIKTKYNVLAENMEGFGVAKACEKLGIFLVEIRIISNLLATPEREWDKNKANEVLREVWECLIKNWK